MDSCATSKDLYSHIKQHVQDLLSALRRRDANDFCVYLKMMIKKPLKVNNKHNYQAFDMNNQQEKMAVLYLLKEAESVSMATLESQLAYMAWTKVASRQSCWSLIYARQESIQPR